MESLGQYQCSGCGMVSDDLEEITNHAGVCQQPREEQDQDQVLVEQQGQTTHQTGKEHRTDAASRLLLELYEQRQHLFGDPKVKKRTIWKEITDQLVASGYKFTPQQTENRWKTMTAAYRRAKDNDKKTGRQRKSCPFEKELDDLLGDRPNVQPVCQVASLTTPTSTDEQVGGSGSAAEVEGSPSGPSEGPPSGPSPSGPPTKKRCRETREDRVLTWLEAHEKRAEAAAEQRHQRKIEKLTEVMLRCHREKMERLDQALAKMNGGKSS